jgi:hypothetical protein
MSDPNPHDVPGAARPRGGVARLLVSVLTQHNLDFATGTRRVFALLPALVASVLA